MDAANGSKWKQFIVLLFGTFITINAMVFQAPALPVIAAHFEVPTHLSGLFILSFYIVSATLYPISGRLADQYGRKKVLLFGLAIFGLSEYAAALSPTFSFLLGMRVLQAIGVSCIFPIAIAYIGVLFRPDERGKASGILDSSQAAGSMIGSALAGFMIKAYGWPIIYWVSGALATIGFFVVLFFVRESKGDPQGSLDFVGFVLLFIMTAAMLSVSTLVETFGMTSVYTLATLAIGVIAAIFMWIVENRVKNPMVDLSLLKVPLFAWVSLIYLINVAGMQVFIYPMNFFLALRPGGDVAEAGLFFSYFYAASIVGGIIVGVLADKIDNKKLLIAALLLPIISLTLFSFYVDASTAFSTIGMFSAVFGLGVTIPIIFKYSLSIIPADQFGAGSGILSYLRDFGAPLGSVTGIVLFSSFSDKFIGSSVADEATNAGISANLMNDVETAASTNGETISEALSSELLSLGINFEDILTQASSSGLTAAMQMIFIITIVIFVALIVFSFFLPKQGTPVEQAEENQEVGA